ncbi:unnamed protein product [Rangifer tarandus platyrhynchus]|uniref:Uncharacterized protein n=2 Tax=Rangifer tarandus platyrhynchus TaxID=3082113 RepID=A0ABN8YTH7_RANTA|nr:unnamed protein product [Rangifer tarandus platyrhynchus]CAI9702455.1 unnamed protein product [Rangifer tarandus platyrhynchus]
MRSLPCLPKSAPKLGVMTQFLPSPRWAPGRDGTVCGRESLTGPSGGRRMDAPVVLHTRQEDQIPKVSLVEASGDSVELRRSIRADTATHPPQRLRLPPGVGAVLTRAVPRSASPLTGVSHLYLEAVLRKREQWDNRRKGIPMITCQSSLAPTFTIREAFVGRILKLPALSSRSHVPVEASLP